VTKLLNFSSLNAHNKFLGNFEMIKRNLVVQNNNYLIFEVEESSVAYGVQYYIKLYYLKKPLNFFNEVV
jgi:hypothetical protein